MRGVFSWTEVTLQSDRGDKNARTHKRLDVRLDVGWKSSSGKAKAAWDNQWQIGRLGCGDIWKRRPFLPSSRARCLPSIRHNRTCYLISVRSSCCGFIIQEASRFALCLCHLSAPLSSRPPPSTAPHPVLCGSKFRCVISL